MNDTKLKYKSTVTRVGVILLIFVGFLSVFMSVYLTLPIDLLPEPAATIIDSIVYDAAYLAAFMLPVAFVKLIFKPEERQPMRLEPRISWNVFAFICIGVAFTYAFSYINSMVVDLIFSVPVPEDMFNYATPKMSNGEIILEFITIALVPAFCEEFLFRGVVLSTLMPYGKSTAVVISAVCFGLMHGNFYQFLYTTVAGLILGAVYVMTDSIWPGTIIHMINNALSVLQMVMMENLTEEYAYILWIAVECLVFASGIISFVVIVRRYKHVEKEKTSVFGKPLAADLACRDAGFWGHSRLDAVDSVKAFFAPTIIAFIVYALFEAFAMLAAL